MTEVEKIKNAAIALILGNNDVRVLMQRTKQNTLGFPGGRIDDLYVDGKWDRKETPLEAVRRELKEETAIDVHFVDNCDGDGNCKMVGDSYPVLILDSRVFNENTVVYVAKLVGDHRINTDAWRTSEKALQETSGVYAVKTANISSYNCVYGTPLLHGGTKYKEGTKVRGCALDSIKYIQEIIARYGF